MRSMRLSKTEIEPGETVEDGSAPTIDVCPADQTVVTSSDGTGDCLAEIPERLAEAFIKREMDGLSTAEICKELGITATNSWVMLYRARMSLRRCLENKWLSAGS